MTTWKKIIYGAGDSGFSLTSTALALLYLDFLVSVVGLDPRLAGISIGLGRIWDAFNDLVIGTLSDRTCSRWPPPPLPLVRRCLSVWPSS
ncbi:MFS transporter [Candidatus Amarolinea dominans]|uniref:MFS transporter n=1 Tax=Candidatus Amarolinea dominans TaxID=3140696 RepID=UPI001DB240C5|nr:MFS transporter [Anaerolineae bacterium]